MASKKRRVKRHNPDKRAQSFFNAKFRVWTWEADRDANDEQIAYAQQHLGTFWRDVGTNIARTVLARPQNWSVCIRALCWTGSGDSWVEEVTVTCRDTKLQDLKDIYLRYRAEVLAACQSRHVYDIGWLAQTFGTHDPAESDKWAMIEMGEISEARRDVWRRVNEELRSAA